MEIIIDSLKIKKSIENISKLYSEIFYRKNKIHFFKEDNKFKEFRIKDFKSALMSLKAGEFSNSELLSLKNNMNRRVNVHGVEKESEKSTDHFLIFLSCKYPCYKKNIENLMKNEDTISFLGLGHFKENELIKSFEILNEKPNNNDFGDSFFQLKLSIKEFNNIITYEKYSKIFKNNLIKISPDFKVCYTQSIYNEFKDWFLEYKEPYLMAEIEKLETINDLLCEELDLLELEIKNINCIKVKNTDHASGIVAYL